tara:strand:+ start:2099 stop:3343 length:1245 start_codon:yes stop_codon:yes gene_type:complete
MEIEKVKTDVLIPYVRNARTHSDEQVAQICGSIKEFGFTNPVLIDSEKVIIAGHGRVMAAQRMGLSEVPCITLDYLTEAQKKAYIIADNQLALNAGWNEELLALEIEELNDLDFNLDLLGFDDPLKFLPDKEGHTDEDEVPDVPDNPVTKEGDLWVLGNHKILCGDSTSEKVLSILMQGKKADLVFTDPPYNADYKSRGADELLKKGIKNDNMSDDEFQNFIEKVFCAIKQNIYKGSSMYVCCNWKDSYPRFYFIAKENDVNVSNCIVWNKESAGMGWQDYRYQFEFILYGFENSKTHNFYGDRTNTDLWSLKREARQKYVHPTQKPVELIEKAIKNSSLPEHTVLDLFLGSGSTLIASQKNNRKCFGIELDPKYCDVIIERWQNYTQEKAILESNGKTFEELKNSVMSEKTTK